MSKYNQLSEKDELIKSLREKANNTSSSVIKTNLETKISILEKSKTVNK